MTKATEEKRFLDHVMRGGIKISEAIVYIFKFRMKEFLFLVIILMLGYHIASNMSYDKHNGFQWKPSIKTNIEVRK